MTPRRLIAALFLALLLITGSGQAVLGAPANGLQSTAHALQSTGLNYCSDFNRAELRLIDEAVSYVRLADEASSYLDLLIDYEVCIEVERIAYNGGYMETRGGSYNRFSGSRLVIASDYFDFADPVFLASVFVHESGHFQSRQSKQACWMWFSCTTLDNGIKVEEEMYATAVEARWWIELFGPDGIVDDEYPHPYVEEMVIAYLAGEETFREFIIETRSDPREGQGID